jgi:hypothetical protein
LKLIVPAEKAKKTLINRPAAAPTTFGFVSRRRLWRTPRASVHTT